jgi:hypothetical protein
MNAPALIDSLARFPQTLSAITAGLSIEAYRRRGPAGQWSIVEIVGHLVDEEQLDFPVRLHLTLTNPTTDWPPIDPEATVRKNNWQDALLAPLSAKFAEKRAVNLRDLAGVENPDWAQIHTHPKFGSMSAGELLASWAAHDWLHLRQICKRLFECAQENAQPFCTDYAGQW